MDTVKMDAPMPEGNKCPQCGTPLPAGTLAGLCPACLLKLGAATDTVTDARQPAFNPPTVAELAPLFPQLEILELIGKGGMGAVYKARQKQLDRVVALKILPPGIGDDPAFAGRFTREAKALAKLNHPGIVTLYEFGVAAGVPPGGKSAGSSEGVVNSGAGANASAHPGGKLPSSTAGGTPAATSLYFFLMEFVDGVNLRQLLHAGRISPREALAIVPQICDALQFAHDQGIVHRDIKPENILMDRRGRVKVADFGLAKIISNDAPLSPPLSPSDGERVAKPGEGSPVLTDADKIMGTPQYMSPEQIQAPGEVDHRADIYALGVVFYQMLTGELPDKQLEPPSKKVHIDVRLDEIVLRALEKKPELRYQQASVLKTQVETIVLETGSAGVPPAEPGVAPGSCETQNDARASGATPDGARETRALPEPRFSRTAIVGASWLISVILTLVFYSRSFHIAHPQVIMASPASNNGHLNGEMWMPTWLMAIYLIGITAIPGTTILGWIAVAQIRRSAGKLHGLWLAVFDGMFFPLLALDFLIWYLCIISTLIFRTGSDGSDRIQFAAVALVVSIIISLLVDWLIIRRVWHAVNQSPNAPAPPIQKLDRFWRWFVVTAASLTAALIFIAMIGLLAAIAIPNFVRARNHALALQQTAPNAIPASAETWSPTLAPGQKPDLQKIRDDIQSLLNASNYEGALQRQIWYFNHALEFGESDPVRLSFGIMQWGELGRRYPKARQALTEIRDRDARQFASGGGYFALFSEIANINRELGDDDSTCTLFKSIEQRDPQLAQQCYGFAENILVEKGEYATCLKYLGDPQARFDFIRSVRERMTEILDRTPQANQSQMRQQANKTFVNDTRKLIEILVATGHQIEAEKIQDEAVAVFNDPRLQSAVSGAEETVRNKLAGKGLEVPITGSGSIAIPTASEAAANPSFDPVTERTKQPSLSTSAFQIRLVAEDSETNIPTDIVTNFLGRSQIERLRLTRDILLDGKAVERAGWHAADGRTNFVLGLTEAGSQQFEALTAANLKHRIAIIFQGQVLTAPIIESRIFTRTLDFPVNWSRKDMEQTMNGLNQMNNPVVNLCFGPEQERVLPPLMENWVFLNFRNNRLMTNSHPDSESRAFHDWQRDNGSDVAAAPEEKTPVLVGYGMTIASAVANGLDNNSPDDIWYNWNLMVNEPKDRSVLGINPKTAQDTYYFRTRDDTWGILQVVGFTENPRGVKIRYKLVQNGSDSSHR